MSNYVFRNENSELIKEIVTQIASSHDLNITIITAKPANKDTNKNEEQQK